MSLRVMTENDLRSRYEAAVLGLRARVVALRGEGRSPEMIARAVHAERLRLATAFKELTPERDHQDVWGVHAAAA